MEIKKSGKMIAIIASLPKSIYFNLKVFNPRVAIKLPVIVHYHTKIKGLFRGCIQFDTVNVSTGMIQLGLVPGSDGVFQGEYPRYSGGYFDVKESCCVHFAGKAGFASGFSIRLDNGGQIYFGRNFTCNTHCFFASNSLIRIGDRCTLGWDINVRDVDGHTIFCVGDDKENQINMNKDVVIGDHVWIASHVDILKGTMIPDDSVVAYGSLLTGQKFTEKNCIIGGNPARVLRTEVNWKL